MVRDLTDILADTVSAIAPSESVLSVTNDGGTHTITLCDIHYAQKGFQVKINGILYSISDVDRANNILTLTGSDAVIKVGDICYFYKIFFFHGTPIEANVELGKIINNIDKLPMSWLWELFEEKFNAPMESVERESDIELYFLTEAKHDSSTNQDLYEVAVKPMRAAAFDFIATIKADTANYSTDDLEYSIKNYPKFGVYARNKGSQTQLIGKDLSGVGMKIKLKFWKGSQCLCQ